MRTRRWLAPVMIVVASIAGIASLAYPYTLATINSGLDAAHATDAPLAMIGIILLSLASIMAALDSGSLDGRRTGALATLIIANALALVFPGPLGKAAGIVLPVLYGFANGGLAGFLLGALSVLLAALLRWNVDYALPGNMLVLGWAGLVAGWLGSVVRRHRARIAVLAAWALSWTLLSGLVASLWAWPYLPGAGWVPGMAVAQAARSFASHYARTALVEGLAIGLLAAALEALAAALLLEPLLHALDCAYGPARDQEHSPEFPT